MRFGVLVVKDDAREVAVDTIVKVEHVARFGDGGVVDVAAGDDIACQGVCAGDEVAARLADDTDRWREMRIQSIAQNGRHFFKEGVACKAASYVERLELVAYFGGLIEDSARVADCLNKGVGIGRAGAYMKADADHIKLEFFGELQESLGAIQRSTELQAQTTEARRIVGQNAQEELGIWKELLDLVKLVRVVKGHLLDANLGGVANVGLGLAGLSIDDAGRVHAELQDGVDFGLGCTVKAIPEGRKEAQDLRIGVAFDRYQRNEYNLGAVTILRDLP